MVLIGLVVGCIGTLIGAGGGFILMPILLILYPKDSPDVLTGISLAVVFFNALSGSIAYARMKRIDFRSGLAFSAATIPGALLGVYTISYINRTAFNIIFGILLIGISIYLFYKPAVQKAVTAANGMFDASRNLTDADGNTHTYSFSLAKGIVLSVFVGFISSMLGIGGGIIHVPAMVGMLGFPVHIATATSHFVLAIMALAGTIEHLINGTFEGKYFLVLAIAIGVLIGAQAGARLSNRIHGKWIIRSLAVALGLVGLRMVIFTLMK